MLRQRHVPMRRCVACGTHRPKKELVHIVRTAQGEVTVDLDGRGAGRGAYLCRLPDCWEQGIKRNRLDHALKVRVSDQGRERLQEFASTLVQQVKAGK